MNEWEDHDVTIIKYHYFCSILLGLGLEYFIDDNKDNIKKYIFIDIQFLWKPRSS